MRLLIAHVSKHGSTAGIAERIADVLGARDVEVKCGPAAEVSALGEFDALVFGAAVYAGAWPKEAAAFVDRVAAEARGLPTWVFSSGPVGDPPRPQERPAQADAVADRLTPRDHVVFAGAIEKSRLSLVERGIVAALRIPYGDYRDWAAIEEWAEQVGDSIETGSTP